jgi:hypothetical protein
MMRRSVVARQKRKRGLRLPFLLPARELHRQFRPLVGEAPEAHVGGARRLAKAQNCACPAAVAASQEINAGFEKLTTW